MYSSSLGRTIVVVVLSLNMSLVSCSCKIEQTKQTLNKTCEWSNWLPTLDCTSCGCNHTELLAFRKRAICCESNATLDTCLQRCGYRSNDDTKYENCSHHECLRSSSDTCNVSPISETQKSVGIPQTLPLISPSKSELVLPTQVLPTPDHELFSSPRTFQFTPTLSDIQFSSPPKAAPELSTAAFEIMQPSAALSFYSTLATRKTENLLNISDSSSSTFLALNFESEEIVPSVTYSTSSLSPRLPVLHTSASSLITTTSLFESTSTFKGLNVLTATPVSYTESNLKLEPTKTFLSSPISKSTLTQYEVQKAASTSYLSSTFESEATVPSVTYLITSLSSNIFPNGNKISHFGSTPTIKGFNLSLSSSVSDTESSSKLESTKIYLSFSKSTLTQYKGQKSTSTSIVSMAEQVEVSLMTRIFSNTNDVNATPSSHETYSAVEHDRVGTIIGAVCGTLAAFAIIAILLILLVRKKQMSTVEPKADKESSDEIEMQNDVEPAATFERINRN